MIPASFNLMSYETVLSIANPGEKRKLHSVRYTGNEEIPQVSYRGILCWHMLLLKNHFRLKTLPIKYRGRAWMYAWRCEPVCDIIRCRRWNMRKNVPCRHIWRGKKRLSPFRVM